MKVGLSHPLRECDGPFCHMDHNRNDEWICPSLKLLHMNQKLSQPGYYSLAVTVYLVHILDETHDLTGIAPFIIVETDDFEKVGIHLNALSCVED